jgi:hypothetical protein
MRSKRKTYGEVSKSRVKAMWLYGLVWSVDTNPMDIKIQKPTVKSTFLKKAKFMLVIELDTMITYTKASRLYKLNSYSTPMKRCE